MTNYPTKKLTDDAWPTIYCFNPKLLRQRSVVYRMHFCFMRLRSEWGAGSVLVESTIDPVPGAPHRIAESHTAVSVYTGFPGASLPTAITWPSIGFRTGISNHIHIKLWDVITHPCHRKWWDVISHLYSHSRSALLTHLTLVLHICVGEVDHHWFR